MNYSVLLRTGKPERGTGKGCQATCDRRGCDMIKATRYADDRNDDVVTPRLETPFLGLERGGLQGWVFNAVSHVADDTSDSDPS